MWHTVISVRGVYSIICGGIGNAFPLISYVANEKEHVRVRAHLAAILCLRGPRPGLPSQSALKPFRDLARNQPPSEGGAGETGIGLLLVLYSA